MTSSVSVMSSPSLDSRDPPQQLQVTGPGETHFPIGKHKTGVVKKSARIAAPTSGSPDNVTLNLTSESWHWR
jgi:hypothetical protein